MTSTHSASQAKGLLLLSRQCQGPSDSPLPGLTLVAASIQGLGSKVARPCPWKRRPQMWWSGWKALESGRCIRCTSVVSVAVASHGHLGRAGDATPPGSSHQAQARLVGVPQLREGRGGRGRGGCARCHVGVETPRHFVVAMLQLLPRRRRRNAQDLVATTHPEQSSEHGGRHENTPPLSPAKLET